MDSVVCKEVIVSSILRRGTGQLSDPIRYITQVFEKDGALIAEKDPCPGFFTQEEMVNFANTIRSNARNITKSDLSKWQEEELAKDKARPIW